MNIEHLPIDDLIPYARNSRIHSEQQIDQVAASIREFGFTNPVLIDAGGGIIAGHGRVMAARRIGVETVPCIRLGHLTEAQKRAYVIADNKLAENAGWDSEMLTAELEQLADTDFDLSAIGFDDELETEAEPGKEHGGVREIATSTTQDRFWISVRGPLRHQAEALSKLRELMSGIPVQVELGTTEDGQ